MAEKIATFLRFCVVGTVGFVVDSGTTLLLTQIFEYDPYRSRIVAFIIAATATWALNRRFTFRSERGVATWIPYVVVTSIGAGINVGTYVVWLIFVPANAAGILSGIALGSGVALGFNFFVSRRIFASPPAASRQ